MQNLKIRQFITGCLSTVCFAKRRIVCLDAQLWASGINGLKPLLARCQSVHQSCQIGFFQTKIWRFGFFTTLMVLVWFWFFWVNLCSKFGFFWSFFVKVWCFCFFFRPKNGDGVFKNAKFGKRFPRVRRNLATLDCVCGTGRRLLLQHETRLSRALCKLSAVETLPLQLVIGSKRCLQNPNRA